MSAEILIKMLDSVSPTTKQGIRTLTALVILVLAWFFGECFVGQISVVSQGLEHIPLPASLSTLAFAALFYIIVILSLSSDRLYYSASEKNRFARAFQKNWPSRYLAGELHLDLETAKHLWFDEFNKWRDSNHPQHGQWEATLGRGFACRLVYSVLRSCWLFVLLGLLFIVAEYILATYGQAALINEETRPSRWLFVGFVGALWLVIRFANRLTIRGPTGVWRRFDEINSRNIHWIKVHRQDFQESARLLRRGENAAG
jgi:hypothetical protein